jgi:hypothetical protein
VRCPRCGNDNSEDNRFCGMCGAKLLPTQAVLAPTPVGVAFSPAPASPIRPSTPPSAAAPVPAKPQAVTAPRPSAQLSEDSPIISGPSFLGLSGPAPRKRASLSADPHSSSSNLDYLLEDEEEPRRGGAGKFLLILLALALAVGFGYLRWKNQGLPWLHLGTTKPAPAAQNSDATDTTSTLPSPTSSAPLSPAAPQPAPENAAQPAPDSSSGSSPATANPAATPDTGNTPATTAPDAGDTAGSSDTSNTSPDSATASPVPAAKESTLPPPDARPAPSSRPKKAAAEPTTPKPDAGITPAKLVDPVSESQKYIYGRGVSQDCDRGMRLLKPAAAQANPKAMIEMGALYSAGLCTPHDLPTAYRWFAMALRKDPENQSVQADLQKLWGEMTQPERQLAIKLSQ